MDPYKLFNQHDVKDLIQEEKEDEDNYPIINNHQHEKNNKSCKVRLIIAQAIEEELSIRDPRDGMLSPILEDTANNSNNTIGFHSNIAIASSQYLDKNENDDENSHQAKPKDQSKERVPRKIQINPWIVTEDALLLKKQSDLGNDWATIIKSLPGRGRIEAKVRYAAIKRAKTKLWTKEEDDKILELFKRLKGNWKEISSRFSNRTKNALMFRHRELRYLTSEGVEIEPPALGSPVQIYYHTNHPHFRRQQIQNCSSIPKQTEKQNCLNGMATYSSMNITLPMFLAGMNAGTTLTHPHLDVSNTIPHFAAKPLDHTLISLQETPQSIFIFYPTPETPQIETIASPSANLGTNFSRFTNYAI